MQTNELCPDRLPISVPTLIYGSNRGLILSQYNLPSTCVGNFDGLLWYSLMGTGRVIDVSLCDSNYDTYISVLSGSCDRLSCIAKNDNYCGTQSKTSFCSVEGKEYFIVVGGSNFERGEFVLDILEGEICYADSSVCIGAISQELDTYTFGDTSLQKATAPLPSLCKFKYINQEYFQWFKIMGNGQPIFLDTYGSCFDTMLIVYSSRGNCLDLQCYAANDDRGRDILRSTHYSYAPDYYGYYSSCNNAWSWKSLSSHIQFCSEESREYYVVISGYYKSKGAFTLQVFTEDVFCVPNDEIIAAALTPLYSLVDASSAYYGFSGDYYCDMFEGRSNIWYKMSGTGEAFQFYYCSYYYFDVMVLSSENGSPDTCLESYSTYGDCFSDSFSWCTREGETYWLSINVDNHFTINDYTEEPSGWILFFIVEDDSISCSLEKNDLCSFSTELEVVRGVGAEVTQSILLNGGELDEFIFDYDRSNYFLAPQFSWFTFTGTGMKVLVSTCNSEFNAQIAVIEDCEYDAIVSTDSSSCFGGAGGKVDFCAVKNIQYYALVNPISSLSDDLTFTLKIQEIGVCTTDPVDVAVELYVDNTSRFNSGSLITLVDLHRLQFSSSCGIEKFNQNYWYTFSLYEERLLSVSACSEFDLFMGIFQTNTVTWQCLEEAHQSEEVCSRGYSNEIIFCGSTDSPYYIFIGNVDDSVRGFFEITIEQIGYCESNPRQEYDCNAAHVIPVIPYSIYGDMQHVLSSYQFRNCNNTNLIVNWFTIAGNGRMISTHGCDFGINMQVLDSCSSEADCIANSCEATWCAYPDQEYYIAIGKPALPNNDRFVYVFNSGEVCTGPPSTPEVFVSLSSSTAISFEWETPFSYGFPILSYYYELFYDGGNYDTVDINTQYTGNGVNITNLIPNTYYYFVLKATNRWGDSDYAILLVSTFEGDCALPFFDILSSNLLLSRGSTVTGNLFLNVPNDFKLSTVTILAEINQETTFYLTVYESTDIPGDYLLKEYYSITETPDSDEYYYYYYSFFGNYYYYDYYYDNDYISNTYSTLLYKYSPVLVTFPVNIEFCEGKSYFLAIYTLERVKFFQAPLDKQSSCLGDYVGFSFYSDSLAEFRYYEDLTLSPFYMTIDAHSHINNDVPLSPIVINKYSTQESITIEWNNECFEKIEYLKISINSNPYTILPVSTTYTFENLTPNTYYTISLLAGNSFGESDVETINIYTQSVDYTVNLKTLITHNDVIDTAFTSTQIIATDYNGNMIIFGRYSEYIKLSKSYQFVSNPSVDNCYLASFSSYGSLLWAREIGKVIPGDDIYCSRMVVDSAGNIFIAGDFEGTIYLNDTYSIVGPTAQYRKSIYLAKYDSNGQLLYSKHIAGEVLSYCYTDGIVVDSDDNLILTGVVIGIGLQSYEDNYPFTLTTGLLVVKWTNSGSIVDSVYFLGTGSSSFFLQALTSIDSNNFLYITGLYQGVVTIGSDTLSDSKSFITCLNSDLEVQWTRGIYASDIIMKSIVASNDDSIVYIAARFNGNLYYYDPTIFEYTLLYEDPIVLYRPMLLSIDKNGNVNWMTIVADSASFDLYYGTNIYISSLAILPSGDVIGVGGYSGAFVTSSWFIEDLPYRTDYSGFVFHMSKDNTLKWNKGLGFFKRDQFVNTVAIYNHKILISGDFTLSLTIDCDNSLNSVFLNSFIIAFTSGTPVFDNTPVEESYKFTDYSGSVTYPEGSFDAYPNNADVYFLIQPRSVFHVEIIITQFLLSGEGDYITIHDGNSTDAKILRYYNGNNAYVTANETYYYDNYLNQSKILVKSSSPSIFIHFHSDGCGSAMGFTFNYLSSPKLAHCDNDFAVVNRDESGIISENAKGGYKNNADCYYYITPSFDVNYIIIDFLKFVVEPEDYLEIYNGVLPDPGNLIANFTGNSPVYTVQSNERSVSIHFVSNEKNYNDGWVIKYTGTKEKYYCSGEKTLYGPEGRFRSQIVRSKYLPTSDCTWNISSEIRARDLSSPIKYLYFSAFNINPLSSVSVSYQQAGVSYTTPIVDKSKVVISDGQLSTHFLGNSSIGNGFEGVYCVQSSSDCPDTILTDPSASFDNHYCGLWYQSNANCKWIIQPQVSNIDYIMLIFSLIDFTNPSAMVTDYLSISECNNTICTEISKLYKQNPYYNNNGYPVIVSDSKKLIASFSSDTFDSAKGFNATYCTAIPNPSCNNLLTSPTGDFNNYFCGKYYGANVSCSWTSDFGGKTGTTILIFDDLIFGDTNFNNSWADNLYIYNVTDGELLYTMNKGGLFVGYEVSPAEQLQGKNPVPDPAILSFGTPVMTKFVSDDEGFATGFNATYCLLGEGDSRLCSGNTSFTQNNGIFGNQACASYYQPNANCSYIISPNRFVASENNIILFFHALNFANKNGSKPDDFITVYDGPDSILATYAAPTYTLPIALVGSQPSMKIDFISDSSLFGTGFVAEYCLTKSPAETCGGTSNVFTAYSDSFKDHTCGPSYIAPLSCTWRIQPPVHNFTYIIVTFSKLDIGTSDSAIVDILDDNSVKVKSSYPNYSVLSPDFGRSIVQGLAVVVETSSLNILFTVKEDAKLLSGWKVDYIASNDTGVCNPLTTYHNLAGIISDHIYGKYYENFVNCAFLIQIPKNLRIAIKFEYFDLEDGFDFLEVYDGEYWTNELIGLYTGSTTPDPFISTSNSLYLVFSTNSVGIKSGFSLYYSDSSLLDCPLFCSNKGECVDHVCQCEAGRYGLGCEIPPPPFVVSATYTPSLSNVDVLFSRDTNRANMYFSNYKSDAKNCSHILAQDTINKLGKNPTCYWSTSSFMVIRLGYNSTLTPNVDTIDFIGGVLADRDITPQTPFAEATSIILQLPATPAVPQVMIVGSSTYKHAFGISLSALGTYVDGARPLNYQWKILACVSCIGSNCSCSTPEARLETFMSKITGPELYIPPTILSIYSPTTIFRLTTTATNFIGLSGDSFPFDLSPQVENMPAISILGPTVREVSKGETLLIKSVAEVPDTHKRSVTLNCPEIQYYWAFESCTPSCPFNLSSQLTSSTSQLYLDTNLLEYGGDYEISVTVTLDQNPTQRTKGIVHIHVAPIALKLNIIGGDQVVSKDKDLNLFAKITNPPITDLQCVPTYKWSCRKASGFPCILDNEDYLDIPASNNVTVSVSHLLPGSYIFTSKVNCGSLTATDTVGILVLRRTQTQLKILNQNPLPKHNPSDPLILTVVSAEPGSLVLENILWSVADGNLELSTEVILSESLNEYQLVIAPNVLEGGCTLRIRVQAKVAGLELGLTELEILVNDPPAPGILYLSQSVGDINTEFLFLSVGATDSIEDLPLRYVFGVKPVNCLDTIKVNGECPNIPLSNILEYPAFEGYLPPGEFYPFVDIIDRQNAVSHLEGESPITVHGDCPTSNDDLLDLLQDLEFRMTSLSCLGQQDQVRQLFILSNYFTACSAFPFSEPVKALTDTLAGILDFVTSTTQITRLFLDNQIKTQLITSTNFENHNNDDKKMILINKLSSSATVSTSLGFARSDSAGSILNALSNILKASVPTDSLNTFTQTITMIGSGGLQQYVCNNIAFSTRNSDIQLTSRRMSVNRLQGESINTSSSGGSTFILPSSFGISSAYDCVEYHAVEYIVNPYWSADNSSILLSTTSDLSFTSNTSPISVNNLNQPIQISIRRESSNEFDGIPICNYWDESSQSWQTNGCTLISYDNDYFYLFVTHLTSFAVLLGGGGGGGSESPISFSIPDFDPYFSDASIIFGTTNLNEDGNLKSSFTEFSLLPPSAFAYPVSEFLSKVYDALDGEDEVNGWNTISILSIAFIGGAIVCFVISAFLLSFSPVRRRLNGSAHRIDKLKSKSRKKNSGGRSSGKANSYSQSDVNASIPEEVDEGDYWDDN